MSHAPVWLLFIYLFIYLLAGTNVLGLNSFTPIQVFFEASRFVETNEKKTCFGVKQFYPGFEASGIVEKKQKKIRKSR